MFTQKSKYLFIPGILLLVVIMTAFWAKSAFASCTFTVTNTNDSGTGSLRQAIANANGNGSSLDTICFDIPGGAYQTISVDSMLQITEPVIIDGTTQPGYSGSPVIEINGANAGAGTSGFDVTGGGSTLKGLIVNRFGGDGIILNNNGGNTVEGNYVGTNSAGTVAFPNGASGIGMQSPNNTIGGTTPADRNIVSGNTGTGIAITGSSAGSNVIEGNYVGTDPTGTTAIPNGADGMLIDDSPNNTVGGTTGTTTGGNCTGACNLFSGNGANGMGIEEPSASGNTVIGNYAGVDVTGLNALPNANIGIEAQNAPNNTIGGTNPIDRNIFSGNGGAGVSLTGTSSTGDVVEGNYIGTDVTGQVGIGNHKMGINIGSPTGDSDNAGDNIIGGTTGTTPGGSCTGACNVISSNAWNGIYISGSTGGGNQIVGNYIGTSASGGLTMGNVLDGIGILDSSDNSVGGPAASARNIIAGNGGNGIVVIGSTAGSNRLEGNYIGEATNQGSMPNHVDGISIAGGVQTAILDNDIYSNGFLGIDLGNNGISHNNPNDVQTGANGSQNFPVLSYAIPYGSNELIAGTFNSLPNTSFRLDFFQSPSCNNPPPNNYGQGQTYLGNITVTTDGSGNTSFSNNSMPLVPGGMVVTATANRIVGSTAVEGSEFSACVATPRAHPDGSFIRPAGSNNIYEVENGGENSQVGSSAVLASYNLPTDAIKTATSADTNQPAGSGVYFREGSLLRGSTSDIYVVDQTGPNTYTKSLITSSAAFNGLGYTPAEVLQVSDSALPSNNGPDISNASQHPDGTVVEASNGTLYWLDSGEKDLIGSPAVFVSQNFNAATIKQATAADLSLSNGPNVYFSDGTLVKGSDATIYVIENPGGNGYEKDAIASPESFTELGYSMNDVLNVPDNVLPITVGPSI